MAQLKDTIVSGNLRVTDTTLTDTLQVTTIKAPTSSGGTTYGPGTSGQVLKSNGTSVYWGSDSNSVTGVKGNAETSYRTGNVNLTPANIGALALSGGTMTGNITFTPVTSTSYPASSNQLYWSGSTDWAKIYYRVDASDAGKLVFDIGDDTNTRIAFAYNGTAKSYIDTDGNFSGNAANVTGTVAIANGGTGATTRLNALKNLTNENVGSSANYFLTITSSWGKGGYTSVADAKTVLGLKSAAYTESSAYLSSSTNYAGSSSAGGAATSANKLNTNAGATNRPVYFSGGVPVQCDTPASGSWFKGVPLITTDGVMEFGKYIDFHNTNDSTADYDYRMEITTATMTLHATGSSNTLTIKSPGNTQLSFQTTSSGKAYTAPGITCYPLTDTGITSLFNFGGNLVIGGGESAKTLYDNNYDTIKTVENEDLYLCADHDIHIVTGCQTYADKSTIEIDAIGKVYLPSTGGIIVKQRSDSNYVSATAWWNGGTAPNSGEYAPQIGQHNTGGDSSYPGSICILPYKSTTNPWDGGVGLFIKKDHVYIDGVELAKSGQYIPMSGSTSVTGKIGFSAVNTGIWLKDASGIQVGALVDNGSNLWIGAGQSTLRHHKGETFISSGWSGTLPTTASSSLTGNQTIKISVPVYTVDANGNGSWNHTGYPVLHSGNYTSYALASTTKYAGSTSVGGAANSSNVLNSNTRMDYGWNGVNYFNINGTAGNAAKVNDTPTTAWWHIMRFNHTNSAGYYTDLAIPFNTTSLYYKRITAGSVQNGGWVKVLDALNVGYVMSSVIKYDSHARRFTSSKTDAAWNAQAYSNTGYADNVYVSFRAGQTTMYAMIGLDANPSEDANYDKIDYCWYIQNNGALKVYESGTAVTITGHTTYASGDEFRVEYSCGEIRYYHNGTMCRSVTRAVSGKLFFDSSFHNAGNVYDFSYGTSTHSTHTAQIITSTYKSSTFVTSLTSSVITLSDAASSFGGWICGPTKNGRIVISSYQNADDKLYFGYGERGRTTNSYAKAMTWDGPTNTLTADKFVGALQGNATTSSSWATARTLTLGGQLTGSVSVKGDANMTLNGYLDRAFIYDDNAVPDGHTWAEYAWHKFAEVTITTTWTDCVITFLVSRTFGNSAENTGILSAKLRTKGSKDYDSAQLKWLVRNSGLSKDDFVMVYTSTSGTSTKAELWCRLPDQYSGLIFTVLKEHKRQYSTDTSWTLVKTPDGAGSTHGSSSYPTTGITDKIISSDGTITNSTTGNAATATTATNANNVNTTVTNGSTSNVSYGITYVADPNTSESNVVRKTNDFRISLKNGTAGTGGVAELVLGNNKNTSTADNKEGYISLYSSNTSYHTLKVESTTSAVIHTFPAVTGTVPSFTATPTSGQVVITDGTAGGVKSSGYTIATSVPSGAKFTDEKVTQTAVGSTYTNYRPIVISGANSATEGFSPSTTTDGTFITSSLYCQPSTGMLHANIFKAGKASTTDGEIIFYRSGSGNSGETTLKATAQSTSGTYLLPARGNGSYTLSCGHEDLSAPTGSLSAANVLIPSYTKFIKIVFKSDLSSTLYSMVEIPYFGNGDYSALVQVGTYSDGQQGSPRIVMKAVIIQITDGTQTGTKSFTITGSPTTKINGSSVSDYTRNITIHKIYAVD